MGFRHQNRCILNFFQGFVDENPKCSRKTFKIPKNLSKNVGFAPKIWVSVTQCIKKWVLAIFYDKIDTINKKKMHRLVKIKIVMMIIVHVTILWMAMMYMLIQILLFILFIYQMYCYPIIKLQHLY